MRTGPGLAGPFALAGLLSTLSVVAPPDPAAAQSADEILEEALRLHEARLADVEDLTVVQEVMGSRTTVYFEKKTRDGHPMLVPVGPFQLAQREFGIGPGEAAALAAAGAMRRGVGGPPGAAPAGGPGAPGAGGLGDFRNALLEAVARAGMEHAIGEIRGASDDQLGSLFGALEELDPRAAGAAGGEGAAAAPGGRGEENLAGALGKAALGSLKEQLVKSAAKAGMRELAEALGGSAAGPFGSFVGALATGEGVGSAFKSLASGLLQGGIPGGLPGMQGGVPGFGQLPGGAPGGTQGQLLGGLAQAGLSAALGAGMSALMRPNMAALDRATAGPAAMGPDVPDLMRRLAGHVRVAGSEEVDGHATWVLEVVDPAAAVPEAGGEFRPTRVTLHIDKKLYVPRLSTIEGELAMEGESRPFAIRTSIGDYRETGGLLYPHHTVTVMEGMDAQVSDEDREKMQEAAEEMEKKMAEMEKQLAELPPEQRAMVEKMMKEQMPQMQRQLEALAAEGPMEIETRVLEVRVNEGPPAELLPAGGTPEPDGPGPGA